VTTACAGKRSRRSSIRASSHRCPSAPVATRSLHPCTHRYRPAEAHADDGKLAGTRGKPVQRRSEARQLRVPQDSGSQITMTSNFAPQSILVTANHFNSDIRLGKASSPRAAVFACTDLCHISRYILHRISFCGHRVSYMAIPAKAQRIPSRMTEDRRRNGSRARSPGRAHTFQ